MLIMKQYTKSFRNLLINSAKDLAEFRGDKREEYEICRTISHRIHDLTHTKEFCIATVNKKNKNLKSIGKLIEHPFGRQNGGFLILSHIIENNLSKKDLTQEKIDNLIKKYGFTIWIKIYEGCNDHKKINKELEKFQKNGKTPTIEEYNSILEKYEYEKLPDNLREIFEDI